MRPWDSRSTTSTSHLHHTYITPTSHLRHTYIGDGEIRSCGFLDFDDCEDLWGVFGSGAVLPDGEYTLYASLYATKPIASCGIGCQRRSGSVLLSVVPEPASGILQSLGLITLGLCRRQHLD